MTRAALLALALIFALTPARTMAADPEGWSVIGAGDPAQIKLEPCLGKRAPSASPADLLVHRQCVTSDADAIGRITLLVRNDGARAVRLRLRYARADGHVAALPGNSQIAMLWGVRQPKPAARDAALEALKTTGDPVHRGLTALAALSGRDATVPRSLEYRVRAALKRRTLKHAELERLAAGFSRLAAPAGSNAQLTVHDATALLRRLRRARSAGAHGDAGPALTRLVTETFPVLVTRSALVVPGHAVATAALRLELPGSRPASLLNGMVAVRDDSAKPKTVNVNVVPAIPDAKAVRIEPSSLNLTTAGPWSHKSAKIVLIGRDVLGFVALARRDHLASVGDGAGHTATIRIGGFSRADRDRNAATAKVSVEGKPRHGTYKGDLAVFGAAAGGPNLTIAVQSGRSLLIGFLYVSVGWLIGLPVARAISRSKWSFGATIAAAVLLVIALGVFDFAIWSGTWGSSGDILAAIGLGFGISATVLAMYLFVFGEERLPNGDAAGSPPGTPQGANA